MTLVHNGASMRGTLAQGFALNGSADYNVVSKGTMRPTGIGLDVRGEDIVQTGAAATSFSLSTYDAASSSWQVYSALIVQDIAAYVGKVGTLQVVDGSTTTTIAAKAMLTAISLSSADHVPAKAYGINYSFTILDTRANSMTNVGELKNGGFEATSATGTAYAWTPSIANAGLLQRYGTEPIGSGDGIAYITYSTTAGTLQSDDQNFGTAISYPNSGSATKYWRYSWDAALENLATTQVTGSYKAEILQSAQYGAVFTVVAQKTFSIVNGLAYRHSITVCEAVIADGAQNTTGAALKFTAITPTDASKVFIDNVTCEELNEGEVL
jgi:hypothetical protein